MDRNGPGDVFASKPRRSLSARRAWIEIGYLERRLSHRRVALRKESVDRNIGVGTTRDSLGVSLSARRAWIEISVWCTCFKAPYVALRKESVDRNYNATSNPANKLVALRKESVDRNLLTAGDVTAPSGRSPQGERG